MTRRSQFHSRVNSAGPDDCWPWLGFLDRDGYGRFRDGVGQTYAHRMAWEIANGRRMGPGKLACHTCDNPACCNPAHLYEGTPGDNLRDAYARGLKLPIRGSDHVGAKLKEPDVTAIKARCRAGESPHAIANDYPVTPATIYAIRAGRKWAHVA